MKHYIDPKIDCVFKAILGALGREHLLVNFLNAIVELDEPIVDVTIENPYIERQQLDAKLSIVDIKARDSAGRIFQIEMQMTSPVHLFSRMSANLSALHGQQLKKGEHFGVVRETIAIWLLVEDIDLYNYPKVTESDYKFHFEMYEWSMEICLPKSPHLHIVQMNRWCKPKNSTMQPLDYWIYFFMKANGWKHLPEDACTPEIKEAMTVLEEFSNDSEKFEYYQSRQRIQLAELSVEAEHRQIREDYRQAINKLDETSSKLDETSSKLDQKSSQLMTLARTLIASKTMTVEQIADATGMSVDEIDKLVNE